MKKNKFLTPTFDTLRPQWQKFVTKYCDRFNKLEAALYAGYAKSSANDRAKQLIEREDIQQAIKEVMQSQRQEVEEGRAAIIRKLQAQSTVSLDDLCDWDVDINNWILKEPEHVPDFYKCCMGMVSISREGNMIFNQGAQQNALKQLGEYMKWHQEQLHPAPPVMFSFGSIKRTPYDNGKKSEPKPQKLIDK
jgi:hypothetical protein